MSSSQSSPISIPTLIILYPSSQGEKQLSTFTIISSSLPDSYEMLPSIISNAVKHGQFLMGPFITFVEQMSL